MADQLQLRGGTTAQTATFTGALREVTVDTDKDTLVVHDNALAGGYPLLRQDLSNLPAGTIDNADINASAAIVDTKLATIATAGKVSNSATTATDANTASAIVARDASGNFTAGTITAALTGAASSNVLKAGDTMTGALVVPLASAATPSLTFTGDLNTGIYSPGADQVAISTGGTGRLFIDSSGRLLVGTSTARDKLFNGTTSTNIPQFQSERAGGGLVNRLLVTGNNGTVPANEASQLILARSYGTTLNSYTAVTSVDSHLGAISFQGADGTEFVEAASIQCFTDATCGANDMPGRLVFSTTSDSASSPTERMRIANDGNVFVSATAAGQIILKPSSGAANVDVGHISGTVTGSGYCIFRLNEVIIGRIDQNGTSAVSYNTTSDYRLKENVTPVTDGITRLQQLKPSRFNFITDPARTVDGFLAHEVQDTVPEAITGEKDAVDDEGNPDYQGIDQSKLVPLLTAALQEAVAKIETLEARLTAAGI